MLTFVVHLEVSPANAPALVALLAEVRAATLAEEPGVLWYEFARSVERPTRIVVIEVYRDAAAHAAHMASPWVRDGTPRMLALVAASPEIARYAAAGPDLRHDTIGTIAMDDGMTDLERLIETYAIQRLKGRRDHAVDQKDWATYAALHTDDYVAMSIGAEPIVGGRAAADALAIHLAGVTTVHHCHTPVIDFDSRVAARGVWAMEDNLFWSRGGERQWLRGFGFYHERYVRGADGAWRFSYRKLVRTHAETSPGAAVLAMDSSGENGIVGIG